MRDHLMGYAPAVREDFCEPYEWECYLRFGLGAPARMRGQWTVEDCEPTPAAPPPAAAAPSTYCATRGDLDGLGYDTRPCHDGPDAPLAHAPACEGAHADVMTEPACDPPTLSEASRWPFGLRAAEPAMQVRLEAAHLRRLEAIKEAEHERWLREQQALKRDVCVGTVGVHDAAVDDVMAAKLDEIRRCMPNLCSGKAKVVPL